MVKKISGGGNRERNNQNRFIGHNALFCNPDKYTHNYLRVISEVKDKHDYEWWKS
jgi:hypothetical protein